MVKAGAAVHSDPRGDSDKALLYKCEPIYWRDTLGVPKPIRLCLAWITIMLFALTYFAVPTCLLLLFPWPWKHIPILSSIYLGMVIISMLMPSREWPWMRKVGQLWFEVFNMSCNLSPDDLKKIIHDGSVTNKEQYIIGMHPHGIVPFHAVLWAAYCDLYLGNVYGFGAAANVVMYLPFLRNIMAWLSAGSADYKVLKDGIAHGICESTNAGGRKPRHLYILPGGIAEIFTSTPGKHCIVFKKRRGLVKLSIETGAKIVPCYVFGGTDFYHNLATHGGLLSRVSRTMKMSLTIFWGQCFTPIPFVPTVTLCLGEPVTPPTWQPKQTPATTPTTTTTTTTTEAIPSALAEELHGQLLSSFTDMFNKYKAVAGYPDAELEVV